jgi:hypothetical protein
MAAQDPVSSHGQPLRCDHCGRSVNETQHSRTGYTVDYYSLHTGPVETCSLVTDDGERRLTFQRLMRAEEVVTCVDCYRRADVQRDRELRFRAELADGERISDG